MKKIALLLFSSVLLFACNSNKKTMDSDKETSKSPEITEQANETNDMNQLVADSYNKNENILVGKANREGLEQEPFDQWFSSGLQSYEPNPEIIAKMKPLLKDVKMTVFMGTWCHDSQREVPHLYKILDQTDFDYDKLQLYTVTHQKTTPQNFEKGLNINYVPTIILYRDGKEIGRFVEYAQKSLEEDLYDILSGADYKNPYAE